MAVLYRTNAQSRAIEDSLMREGIPYKIIGGVRFYERKEIKDALAYLKLIINPHDDVSLRRVINVPARGIGKGVMDSLQAIDPERRARRCAAAARRRPAGGQLRPVALGQAGLRGRRGQADAARDRVAARVFRDLIAGLADVARQRIGRRSRWARCSIRPATCSDLRDENSEEANERIENLMELVSAAREYETREPEASLGGFVDRLSLLSEADEESGTREAKVWLMTMHAAKGLEFPLVIIAGLEEGLFPHSRSSEDEEELEEERRLCYVGHDAGAVAARAHERGAPAGVRRVPVDRAVTIPRRDPAPSSIERIAPAYASSYQGIVQPRALRVPHEPVRAQGQGAALQGTPRPATSTRTRISPSRQLRSGMRVRHAQFGVGTVVSVEEHNDDMKITVRFNLVGREEAAGEVREAGAGVAARTATAARRSSMGPPPDPAVGGTSSPFSTSFSASFAIATTSSPSSISISRTPWVARPMARTSPARIRRIIPCWLMIISSSSSWT